MAQKFLHTGQILPRTFARTIVTLQPLKDANIPSIAVEGNHDWIHRRDSISWMEALSQMGYIRLLRPSRTESGAYRFEPFDPVSGSGGHMQINGLNIYGLGYIGSQAGNHVERICQAVTTSNNILLFHVGVWTFSPVEIGNMKPEEALPLAETFDYVALGHGHKPFTVQTAAGRSYAFNPGSPECVNFGEERYEELDAAIAQAEQERQQHQPAKDAYTANLNVAQDLESRQQNLQKMQHLLETLSVDLKARQSDLATQKQRFQPELLQHTRQEKEQSASAPTGSTGQ